MIENPHDYLDQIKNRLLSSNKKKIQFDYNWLSKEFNSPGVTLYMTKMKLSMWVNLVI